jgi:gas vesicle protein
MYYDDEARRFNFASGLLLGAILGTGIALLAAPQRRSSRRPLRRSATALKRDGARRLGEARKGLAESAEEVLSTVKRAARKGVR